jgi:hypothetical protein
MHKHVISFCAVVIAASLALGLMTGCSSDRFNDGYQVGEITLSAGQSLLNLSQAIETYCTMTKDSLVKQAALSIIRSQYPTVPEDGICSLLHSRGGQWIQ